MESLSHSRKQSWLSWFFRGMLLLGFLFLVGRAFDLQIIRGDYYRNLAEDNRIRRVPLKAPRGKIIARGGEILVGNKEIDYHLVFNPSEGYSKESITNDTPEEEIITDSIRHYALGSGFAHVSGYIGLVNEDEVGKVNAGCQDKGVRAYDTVVGRGGLEQQYECILTGVDGEDLIEVDSYGNRIRLLGRRNPVAGNDLKTTIHFGLQNYVAEIMSGKREFDRGDIPEGELKGAVVVSDLNGEILALYSSPSFNPNIFVEGNKEKISELFNRSDLPLYNRAIGGTYHPGSVFKPLVGIAAIESNAIESDFLYEDTGVLTLHTDYGDYSYRNWYYTQYGGAEGNVDLVRALARSTDTYFYKVGEMTGIETLVEWSEKFKLGYPTGIDIPGEVRGLIPNPEWKQLAKGERWFLGNTYHFSIGQNDIVLTPLQINTFIASIASDGNVCVPHIAQRSSECEKIEISKEALEVTLRGMKEACSSGGTAFTFFEVNDELKPEYSGKQVACKTGTAQVGVEDKTHAWFTFITPLEDTSEHKQHIVATVLIEEGGEGSKIAGPIARAIYDYWYGFENKPKTASEALTPTPTMVP